MTGCQDSLWISAMKQITLVERIRLITCLKLFFTAYESKLCEKMMCEELKEYGIDKEVSRVQIDSF